VNLKECFLIDAHCDTLCKLETNACSLKKNDLHVSLEHLAAYGGYVQLFAAWVDDACDRPLRRVLTLIDTLYHHLEQNRESMQLILSGENLKSALFSGRIGAMLTVENGNVLEGSVSVLRMLYRLGVRAMTLTWNGENELSDGAACKRGAGLTAFGREVVREMNRLGMLIDVSHLSERGFWETLSLSKHPVMASHSNAKAVTDHPRNLTDEQIRALARRGGFIGLNLYPPFLHKSGAADITDCLRHIEHMLSLGAEDTLGLGSDFDGVSSLPQGIQNARDYSRLFEELYKRGYSDTLIKKLTHENFLRFAQGILL